jgi:hypothetical protein
MAIYERDLRRSQIAQLAGPSTRLATGIDVRKPWIGDTEPGP